MAYYGERRHTARSCARAVASWADGERMRLALFASSMAIIEVATELELTTEFNTGIEVYQEWQDWMADMVLTAPDGLVGAGMVLDGALRCCSGWWLP